MKKSILLGSLFLVLSATTGCQYLITPPIVEKVPNKREFKIKYINPKTKVERIDIWVPPYNIAPEDVEPTKSDCYRKSKRKALGRITVLNERLFRYPDKTNREKFRHDHLRRELYSRENKYKLTYQYQAECLKKLGFRLLTKK